MSMYHNRCICVVIALVAAGAVCDSVDRLVVGRNDNVFCAVRPPGHHAGSTGIVTSDHDYHGSHGFCLLNNVAIGTTIQTPNEYWYHII
jgi:acetoin utilization deacetylase AcuC-like enzyme